MQTSANHPLDLRDPANGEPCPMERLADRIVDAPAPKWLKRDAWRTSSGFVRLELSCELQSADRLDDLINYLARVKG